MGRRTVVTKVIFSLGHCECYGHTVHKLSQRRLTADWLAPRESVCSQMDIKVSSDWLPSYIKTTRPVLELFKMAEYFPNSHRIDINRKCKANRAESQFICIRIRRMFPKLTQSEASYSGKFLPAACLSPVEARQLERTLTKFCTPTVTPLLSYGSECLDVNKITNEKPADNRKALPLNEHGIRNDWRQTWWRH